MESLRIGVIGRTAYGTDICDGQTVKTRVLVEELKIKYPDAKIDIADTYKIIQGKRIGLLLNIIHCMFVDDVIFVLLSTNGRKVVFPIVLFLNKFLHKAIIHDCIGGKIGKDAKNNPRLAKEMNGFTVNYVESNSLVQELVAAGVTNAEYLPNFKRLNALSKPQIKSRGEEIRLCTFSRVCEAKGITDAIKTVIDINACYKNPRVYLDIYGPIEKGYEDQFKKMIASSNGTVLYMGVSNPNESVDILKFYYVLLFPTVFEGEGFPGTLIDAFSSGLPIIATDWHLNSEIIDHGVTGYLYSWKEPEMLKKWIVFAIDNPQIIEEMRYNCLEEAKKYHPDIIMKRIDEKIKEYRSNMHNRHKGITQEAVWKQSKRK